MISMKRPRRPFRGSRSELECARPALTPGSPREIARRMALEGALRLAGHASPLAAVPLMPPPMPPVPMSRPKRGPFAGFRPIIRPIVAGLVLLLSAAAAHAQISSASTAALGMGENYTAAALGLDAVAWNPAGLGYSGRGTGFVSLVVRGSSGLGPVSMRTLSDYSDVLVPDVTKRAWLASIAQDGGQTGTGGADVTWLAMRFGQFAFHASSSARVVADVSPGLAELILFGNVSESGATSDLDLSGSRLQGFAYSAVGATFAKPVATEAGLASLGFTVKYMVGHGLAMGTNSTGAAISNPVSVSADFPLVHSDFEDGNFSINNGHGFGLDIGGTVERDGWMLSGVIQNVYSNFEWNTDRLMYRSLSFRLGDNEASTSTEAAALSTAPAEVQDRVAQLTFKPVYSGGFAWASANRMVITGDVRFSDDQGLVTGPTRHVGAGIEFRLTDWLPVRFGGAAISMGDDADGWQAGTGLGLEFGAWNLSGSAMRRSAGHFGTATTVMISLIGVGR
jgi:hypothetical protein